MASALVTQSQTYQTRDAQTSHQPFRLLDLPPELRNCIYEFVLGDVRYEVCIDSLIGEAHPRSWLRDWSKQTHLALVCRQLYDETALLKYALTLVSFSRTEYITAFLDRLTPSQVQAIGIIRLSTRWFEHMRGQKPAVSVEDLSFLGRMHGLKKIILNERLYKKTDEPEIPKCVELIRVWKLVVEITIGYAGRRTGWPHRPL